MPIVFDQEIHVHYWQFYVESRTDEVFEGLTESRGGQANGLCGAAVPGLLYLTTGLHTGHTWVTVEVLDAPAPIGDECEDVVEASFRPVTAKVALVQWAGAASWPLPLEPIDYRVRYSATGMDRARERDTLRAGEPLLDRYLLQFWPDRLAPDAVIRESSRCAAYWHAQPRTLPSPPTPLERAKAKRREQAAKEQVRREATRAAEARRWGGRLPHERVRRINGALELARLDRELVDGITDLDPAIQRAFAVWAARRACAAAGLPSRHCGPPRPTTRWGPGWNPYSMRWSRSGSTTGGSCPRCAMRSPSWRNLVLAVARVVFGEVGGGRQDRS